MNDTRYVIADALYARSWGSDEDVSPETVADCRAMSMADAEAVLAALGATCGQRWQSLLGIRFNSSPSVRNE